MYLILSQPFHYLPSHSITLFDCIIELIADAVELTVSISYLLENGKYVPYLEFLSSPSYQNS